MYMYHTMAGTTTRCSNNNKMHSTEAAPDSESYLRSMGSRVQCMHARWLWRLHALGGVWKPGRILSPWPPEAVQAWQGGWHTCNGRCGQGVSAASRAELDAASRDAVDVVQICSTVLILATGEGLGKAVGSHMYHLITKPSPIQAANTTGDRDGTAARFTAIAVFMQL